MEGREEGDLVQGEDDGEATQNIYVRSGDEVESNRAGGLVQGMNTWHKVKR
jgi:hypothetical protein